MAATPVVSAAANVAHRIQVRVRENAAFHAVVNVVQPVVAEHVGRQVTATLMGLQINPGMLPQAVVRQAMVRQAMVRQECRV